MNNGVMITALICVTVIILFHMSLTYGDGGDEE